MRIVFMGTPEFAVPSLKGLLHSEHEVVAVYTQPDRPAGRGQSVIASPVKRLALNEGLLVLQPISLRRPGEAERFAELRLDVVIVVAFGQILPQRLLDIPPFGCLNVHASLLPKHRGASPITSAILAGDEYTGVTIMLLDAGMDTGPILTQRRVAIAPEDTTGTLSVKLAQVGAALLMETLPQWLKRSLVPHPQDEREATYSPMLSKRDGEIDWHLSAKEIERRVRAFQPWPGCFTRWKGRSLKIIEAIPLSVGRRGEIGQVLEVKLPGEGGHRKPTLGVGVQTGGGVLGLVTVQLEGGRAMSVEEFLRGQRDFIGAILPREAR